MFLEARFDEKSCFVNNTHTRVHDWFCNHIGQFRRFSLWGGITTILVRLIPQGSFARQVEFEPRAVGGDPRDPERKVFGSRLQEPTLAVAFLTY